MYVHYVISNVLLVMSVANNYNPYKDTRVDVENFLRHERANARVFSYPCAINFELSSISGGAFTLVALRHAAILTEIAAWR